MAHHNAKGYLRVEVRESRSLYIHIYIIMCSFSNGVFAHSHKI